MSPLEDAALENLWPLPDPSEMFPHSDEQLLRDQAWVDEKTAWVATLSDRKLRNAYLVWIDYVQKNIERNQRENTTGNHQREYEKWESESNERSRRATDLARTLPKPPR